MTRFSFLSALLAGLFGGGKAQEPKAGASSIAMWENQYHTQPLKLAPGEEYCPLGHAQKPRSANIDLEYPISSWQRVHFCTVCGIVYVPQPASKGTVKD